MPTPSSGIWMFSVESMNTNAPASFRVHKEIIMILSSESEIRTPMQRALEALGFPVLIAQNQDQADALFRSFDGAIRLLITDISVDGTSALEVIASLRKGNHTLKVVVVSEEVSPRERHDIYIAGVIELIRKPVEKEELLRVVRRIIR